VTFPRALSAADGVRPPGDPEALTLALWREVCRGAPYEETTSRVLDLLASAFPVRGLLIVRTDDGRLGKAVAARRDALPSPARPLDRPADGARALLRGGRVAEGPTAELHSAGLPVPAGLEGRYLVGALDSAEALLGLVVLFSAAPSPYGREQLAAADRLLEPLTSLLQREVAAVQLAPAAPREVAAAAEGEPSPEDEPTDLAEGIIVGERAGLRATIDLAECAAPVDVPVLILGETGSGKEVVARTIHDRSPRAGQPFIKVNCGAIPPELVDSELFGHERGSFTGAIAVRRGWFERAHSGTLFLDEVGELPLAAQVRLLRVLQDGTFERVGAQKTLSVDVRILAATHRDLAHMAAAGTFRRDLWYRLSVFPIHVPPLRERLDDLEALAAYFAGRAGERIHGVALLPTPGDLALLRAHPWPGNVRELAAVIERAVLLGGGRGLDVEAALHLALPVEDTAHRFHAGAPPAAVQAAPAPVSASAFKTLEAVVVEHIQGALALTQGRIEGPGGAAALLGVNPHTLRARMRKLGLDWTRFRGRAGG
jgi:transcriptional regulator with GAF, ATPase, and Fis domain